MSGERISVFTGGNAWVEDERKRKLPGVRHCTKGHEWNAENARFTELIFFGRTYCLKCIMELLENTCGTIVED